METRWSLGVLIGLPFTALLVLALLMWLGGIIFYATWEDRNWGMVAANLAGWVFTTGLCFFLIGILAYWPWRADYHQWRPHTGTISEISSRFLGDGKSTTQRFVVTFEGSDPGPYSCDDTRCALLHKGDWLALSCKKAFQWSGTSGYDCNYVEAKQ